MANAFDRNPFRLDTDDAVGPVFPSPIKVASFVLSNVDVAARAFTLTNQDGDEVININVPALSNFTYNFEGGWVNGIGTALFTSSAGNKVFINIL